ncbi:MAG: hypothetical protein WC391_01725 [Methanoregula sp.]|jgi:hypothetical protein
METTGTGTNGTTLPKTPPLGSALVRLIVIPFAVFFIWVFENFLLEGGIQLFSHSNTGALVIYTVFSCIIVGILVPVICIRKSFLSGDVNMFQIGFRSLRRTLPACAVTGLIAYAGIVFFSPFGQDRMAGITAFLLLLPTAIASVMVCWVLVGTHIQAFFRQGGMAVSILYGVVVTAIFFDCTSFAHAGLTGGGTKFAGFFLIGIIVALFFFAVRDIYASAILLASCMVFTGAGSLDLRYLSADALPVYGTALLTVLVLVLVHRYFFRHYTTIRIP